MKISWGVLSTANIGLEKVIPAMQIGEYTSIDAIASRDYERAKKASGKLSIPKAYGSYEDLLADKNIQAIYIPLPNHLHLEWIKKSLDAGKHVLCEKPITLSLDEAHILHEHVLNYPGLKVMEAFMYRFHPQWNVIKKLINEGSLGEIKNIHSMFSYYNINPSDIRNQADIGGGGLLDIGCYCISVSRFIFEDEPKRICGTIDYDPAFGTDRYVNAIMEFKNGTASFICSTQLTNYQSIRIFGTKGMLEVEWPFTPSPVSQTKIISRIGSETKEYIIEPYNQYTIQGDLFSQAILNNSEVPTPISDAISNMKVIDHVLCSVKENKWIAD